MSHTLSLIESEKRRCEMTLEELQKRGQSPAIQDYYKELVDDYSSAIKILNDKRNVARGEEKSFYCSFWEADMDKCKSQCNYCKAKYGK